MLYKTIISTFFLLAAFFSSNAAIWTKEDSIQVFYEYVHKAEFKILISKYQDACGLYDTAFLYYPHPQATDIHNQLMCFLQTRNYKRALQCCNQLILKGATDKYFKQNSFYDFNKSEESGILAKQYKINHERFLASINNDIIREIKKIFDADQSVHCRIPSNNKDTAFIKRMHNNDDSLAILLNDLLINNDFLSEDVIGASFRDDTTLSESPGYGVVVVHQIQKRGDLLTETISRAMQLGKLRPEMGLEWIGRNFKSTFDITSDYIVFSDTLWKSHVAYPNRRMGLKLSGQDDDGIKDFMHHFYLDDRYYDLEKRIVYNYYKNCAKCISPINKSFYILPAALDNGYPNKDVDNGVQKDAHDHYNAFAFPNYSILSDK